MTTPAQQLVNYVQTTLASGCTNVATVLTLTSVAGLPTVGNFMLRIDDASPATTFEYVEVTSVNVGASQVTCTRGQEGTTGIAHSAGAFVGNDITAAMLLRAFPWGMLVNGYSQSVATQAGITTTTDLTNLSVTVTVGANRRIRVSCLMRWQQITAAGNPVLSIQEGATVLADAVFVQAAILAQGNLSPSVILTPTAGSHTYKLTLQTSAGSVSAFASATEPAYILVEDIGPA